MQSCYEDLIILDVDAKDYEDAIRQVGALLFNGGYVKDTYVDAGVGRELEFLTGLILKDIQIAMPHTAGIHVNTPAVCVAKMKHPVTFGHMGDPDTKVEAEILFMIAIAMPQTRKKSISQRIPLNREWKCTRGMKMARFISNGYSRGLT